MKKRVILLLIFSFFISCQKAVVAKPDSLLDEDEMVNIIYDLALLEAIRAQGLTSVDSIKINPTDYIYNKYKIDSTQFAQNDKFYATDIKKYKKIYDRVAKRIEGKTALYETGNDVKLKDKNEIIR